MKKKYLTGKGFNSNQLKLFAIIAMTIDHLVSVIFPGYPKEWWIIALHIIGRLTAPTMWFMIAEGYFYTRNLKKYIGRLFLFAFISHFAYNFAFGIPFIPFQTSVFNQTSVIWSLAWAVVGIALSDPKRSKLKQWQQTLLIMGICVITFCSDWSCIAVMAIIGIYYNRGNLKKQVMSMMSWVAMYALIYFLFIDKVYGILQLGVIICVPFIMNYNGERGKWKGMKWFFYLYYPAHLIVCGIIRLLLHGNVGVMIGG
ncbi:MAG: conjugal transfer protein TraX [Lachnospiraceae bacterium]|nr:conjugal transfer protein TraX [Lachnospiraceae bacterium]